MNKKQLLVYLQKHAKAHKEKLNPDKRGVNLILVGLLSNKKQHGELYCPCRILKRDKAKDRLNICPCYWHEEEIKKQGHCLCRLFFKK